MISHHVLLPLVALVLLCGGVSTSASVSAGDLFVVGGDFLLLTPDGETLQQPIAYDNEAHAWHSVGGGFPLGTEVFSVQPFDNARALLVCGTFNQFAPEKGAPADGSKLSTVAVYDMEREQWDSLSGGVHNGELDGYVTTARGLCAQSGDGSVWVGMRGFNISLVYHYTPVTDSWVRYELRGGVENRVDPVCATGQLSDPSAPFFFTTLNSVDVQADGSVLIAGEFTEVDGRTLRTPNMARFTPGQGWGEVNAVASLVFSDDLTLLESPYSCRNRTEIPISPTLAPCSSALPTDLCCLSISESSTHVRCSQPASGSLLQIASLSDAGTLLQLGPSYREGATPEPTFALSWWTPSTPTQMHALPNPFLSDGSSFLPQSDGVFVRQFASGGANDVLGYVLAKGGGGEDTGQPLFLGLWMQRTGEMRELELVPPADGRWFFRAEQAQLHSDHLYVSGIVDRAHQDSFQGRVLRWSVPVSEMLGGDTARMRGVWEDTPYSLVYEQIVSGGFVPCFAFL